MYFAISSVLCKTLFLTGYPYSQERQAVHHPRRTRKLLGVNVPREARARHARLRGPVLHGQQGDESRHGTAVGLEGAHCRKTIVRRALLIGHRLSHCGASAQS